MLKRALLTVFVVALVVGMAPASWISQNTGIAYAEKCTCKQGCKCDHCSGKSQECKCPKY